MMYYMMYQMCSRQRDASGRQALVADEPGEDAASATWPGLTPRGEEEVLNYW